MMVNRIAVFLLRATVRSYQLVVAPFLGANCRYLPSCSEYARDALGNHGALRGSALAIARICRCHPWGGSGWDPVPPAERTTPGTESAKPQSMIEMYR